MLQYKQYICIGIYRESLQTMLHRLQVSTQLYRTPDREEDIAAIIIEQVSIIT